jgi:hypothetical protein
MLRESIAFEDWYKGCEIFSEKRASLLFVHLAPMA